MTLDEALDTLRKGAVFDPAATLACCLGEVLRIRRHEPQHLPAALKLYAAVAELAAR